MSKKTTAPGTCLSCRYHRSGVCIECQPGQKPVRHFGLCLNKRGEKGLCLVWSAGVV